MFNSTLCRTFALSGLAFAAAVSAHAGTIPITVANPGFLVLSKAGVSAQFGTQNLNNTTPSQQVSGWTTSGYNFVFVPNGAQPSATGDYGNVKLVNTPVAVPGGGNYLALDSDYATGPVTTTLNGLFAGEQVQLSFYINGDQQTGNTLMPNSFESLSVQLGNTAAQTVTTTLATTGWQKQTLDFTATGTSETLSFLAGNGPGGVPSFVLLSDVSAVGVTPEPNSLALLGTGLLGVAGVIRKRLQKS